MDESSFWRHIECMQQAEVLAIDTETTGIEGIKDGRAYLMGISVAYRLGPLGIISGYFPFRHKVGENLSREHLEALKAVLVSKPLIFHNLKFDLHSLLTIGIIPLGKLYDTQGCAHFVNEELISKKLDNLGRIFLKKRKTDEVKKYADIFGWENVPVSLMDPYACNDAEMTLEIFEHKEIGWPAMKAQELIELWPIERRFTRLLVDIEQRGVGVNLEFCTEMAEKGEARMLSILDELDVDGDSLGPKALKRLLIDDLGLPVIKYTDKGAICFDKHVMAEYDEMLEHMDSDVAKLVLEYRGWQKATSSLYRKMIELVSPDGRVRADFRQHGTVTGRLACAEPNLQQIPRSSAKVWNGAAKKSFNPAPGYDLWGYDYAQLELRLAVAYGRDTWLIECFNDETRDVFTELSERVGEERFWVKHGYVYPTLYGAGKGKIAATLGKTEAEIEPNYEAFKESIKGIRAASDQATAKARQNGYVRYWTGRRRHFPYADGHHKAFNSILQGGAAELVKRAMIRLDDTVCDDNCKIVLQVHDEIVFEIKQGMREHYEPLIVAAMTDFPQFGVKLKVEGKLWNQ